MSSRTTTQGSADPLQLGSELGLPEGMDDDVLLLDFREALRSREAAASPGARYLTAEPHSGPSVTARNSLK